MESARCLGRGVLTAAWGGLSAVWLCPHTQGSCHSRVPVTPRPCHTSPLSHLAPFCGTPSVKQGRRPGSRSQQNSDPRHPLPAAVRTQELWEHRKHQGCEGLGPCPASPSQKEERQRRCAAAACALGTGYFVRDKTPIVKIEPGAAEAEVFGWREQGQGARRASCGVGQASGSGSRRA